MSVTVSANNRTVVHQSSMGMAQIFPDPCKTPTPGGPVPVPYPNIALSKDTTQGTTTVKCDGNPINVKGSEFAISQGDEPGTLLGVISNRVKGEAHWIQYSFNVKADGKNVCRLLDLMRLNGGSSENTPPTPCTQSPNPGTGADGSAGGAGGKGRAKKDKGKKGDKKKGEKKKACRELEKKRIDRDTAQKNSGQLKEHFDANCKTARDTNSTFCFRNSNPACKPHIANGVQTKPMSIKDKTGLDGLVKGKDGQNVLLNGKPVTGDYDLHDMLDASGRSIPGGSRQERSMINALNDGMAKAYPRGSKPMVNHGPWTEWDNAKRGLADRTALSPKGGTVITPDGKFYDLRNEQDWENFRKCKGA
jgi:hypothetical protein